MRTKCMGKEKILTRMSKERDFLIADGNAKWNSHFRIKLGNLFLFMYIFVRPCVFMCSMYIQVHVLRGSKSSLGFLELE